MTDLEQMEAMLKKRGVAYELTIDTTTHIYQYTYLWIDEVWLAFNDKGELLRVDSLYH